jgi:hypothetical protein
LSARRGSHGGPLPPAVELRARAHKVVHRPYSLGDEALLVEAAAYLGGIAVRFLERADGDENDVAHAARFIAIAEELIALVDSV